MDATNSFFRKTLTISIGFGISLNEAYDLIDPIFSTLGFTANTLYPLSLLYY